MAGRLTVLETITTWGRDLRGVLEQRIISVGTADITLMRVLVFVVSLLVLRLVVKQVGRLLLRSLAHLHRDPRSTQSIARIGEITATVIGILIVLDLSGIPISGVVTVFAALGVGIGFGLQNLVKSAISGVIVLFEQQIRPGDYIEVDGIMGEVQDIGLRSTRLRMLDDREVVIPNSVLLEQNVINWTLSRSRTFVPIEFSVHYKSNLDQVRHVALAVAAAHPRVLKDPPPAVQLRNFGESSLEFRLSVWIANPLERNFIASDLRFDLFAAFKAAAIVIPYPQRELHIMREAVTATVTNEVQKSG